MSARHRMKQLTNVPTICALLVGAPAYGMTFDLAPRPDGIHIRAEGLVAPDDGKRFERIAGQATTKTLLLGDSSGGPLVDALGLAVAIRRLGFHTIADGRCASACAMVLYPAGDTFRFTRRGALGFHACHDPVTRRPEPLCNEAIADFAAENGFPWGIIADLAADVPPGEMFWISSLLAPCFGLEKFQEESPGAFGKSGCSLAMIHLGNAAFDDDRDETEASFDCEATTNPIEQRICAHRDLLYMDALLGRVYRQLHSESGKNAAVFASAQRDWAAERDDACRRLAPDDQLVTECIARFLRTRMRTLVVDEVRAGF